MGQQIKIRGASVRALHIFNDIQRIKRESTKELEIKLEKLFKELEKNNALDTDTAEALKVYFNRKSEIDIFGDKILQKIEAVGNEIRSNNNDGINMMLLTLSSDGDLYRQPKTKYCYPMKKSGFRLDIIRFLNGKNYFVPGNDIASEFDSSYTSTTLAINKINEISRRLLGLPKGKQNDLIISKNRGGYKINPLYPITPEEL